MTRPSDTQQRGPKLCLLCHLALEKVTKITTLFDTKGTGILQLHE